MLSAEKNERITRVGPGTPMGDLLRRYWYPIAFETDLDEFPIKQVRLLGEDLALFRNGNGELGLLTEACPHRRASLVCGVTEANGLRCGYHGWLFANDGQCLEQPAEPQHSTFAERIKTTAYKVQQLGGLIFAYLGPDPAPLLPRYDLFVWDGVMRDVGHTMLPCNFLQIMENSVDPHHVEWLHGRYMAFINELKGVEAPQTFTKRHAKIGFDVFEHGIIKRRVLEGMTEEDEDWKVGHPLVFPHMLRVGAGGQYQFQIRVPVDDTHTWHLWYTCYRPGEVEVPRQDVIPNYEVPYLDDRGNFITDFVDGQDMMAWVTQGKISERDKERLGKSDMGITLLRRVVLEQIKRVEDGQDPLGVMRDPAANEIIDLPQEKEKYGSGQAFRTEFLKLGQARYSPIKDEIRELYERAEAKAGV